MFTLFGENSASRRPMKVEATDTSCRGYVRLLRNLDRWWRFRFCPTVLDDAFGFPDFFSTVLLTHNNAADDRDNKSKTYCG
jgi:hypothetical protein